MSTLFGNNISQTYQGLIKLADSTTGVTATTQSFQDGLGNNIPIQVSNTTVNISGSFLVNGQPVSIDTGSFATTGSNSFYGYQNIYVAPGQDTVSVLVQSGSMGDHQIGLTVQPDGSTGLSFANKGNNFFQTNGNLIINSTIGGDGTGSISINVPSGSFNVTSPKVKINDGNITTTGSLIVSGSNNKLIGNINSTSTVNTIIGRTIIQGGSGVSGGATPRLIVSGSDGGNTTIGRSFVSIDTTKTTGTPSSFSANLSAYGAPETEGNIVIGVYTPDIYTDDYELNIKAGTGGTHFQDWDNFNAFNYEDFLVIPPNNGDSPAPQFKRNVGITGSLFISNVASGSTSDEVVVYNTTTKRLERKTNASSSGTSGSSGSSGSDGSSGTSGINGTSGTSGSNGTDGSSGTSGSNGTDGTSGSSGISNSFFNYQAKTTITSGDPGSGHLIWDNAIQSGATQLNLSELTQLNDNIDIFLGNLAEGSTIIIQKQTDHTLYQEWTIGTSVNQPTYWIFNVTLQTSNYSFTNNEDVIFIIVTTPSGTSGTSGTSGSSGTGGSSGTSGVSGTGGSSGTSGDSLFALTGSVWNTTNNIGITGSLTTTTGITIDNQLSISNGKGSVLSNIAIGSGSLVSNTTGDHNIGIGERTLRFLTTGSANTAINTSLTQLVNGYNNTSVGYLSNGNLESGSNNTAIGGALLSTFTGSNNTAIGFGAGGSSVLLDGGVYLGHRAGYQSTGSNLLVIDNQVRGGNDAVVTSSLIVGTFDADPNNQTLRINAATTLNGNTNITGSLDVSGSLNVINDNLTITTDPSAPQFKTQVSSSAFPGGIFNSHTAGYENQLIGFAWSTYNSIPENSLSANFYGPGVGNHESPYGGYDDVIFQLTTGSNVVDWYRDTNFSGSLNISGEVQVTGSIDITGNYYVNGVAFSGGTSGTSGTNGTDGSSGTSGVSGTDGSSGTSGVSGSSGTSGVSGSSGTSGVSGTDGSSGTSGVAGSSGTSGTSFQSPYVGNVIITGSLNITGSVGITGSVQGNVNSLSIAATTASLNLNDGNFFTLQLVSGSVTHINPTNIKQGQTINILLSTTGSGTVSFPTTVKQVSGSAYVPTTTTSKDIITLISFDNTNLYLANVKNLI